MLPARRRSMPRSAGRAVKNAPLRLVSSTARQRSASMRTAGPSRVTPALRTRASRSPSPSSTAATSPAASSSTETSARWVSARRPAASTAPAVACGAGLVAHVPDADVVAGRRPGPRRRPRRSHGWRRSPARRASDGERRRGRPASPPGPSARRGARAAPGPRARGPGPSSTKRVAPSPERLLDGGAEAHRRGELVQQHLAQARGRLRGRRWSSTRSAGSGSPGVQAASAGARRSAAGAMSGEWKAPPTLSRVARPLALGHQREQPVDALGGARGDDLARAVEVGRPDVAGLGAQGLGVRVGEAQQGGHPARAPLARLAASPPRARPPAPGPRRSPGCRPPPGPSTRPASGP